LYQTGWKLAEREALRPHGGASGKCRYDYRVGIPPGPCSRKAGLPVDLPVKGVET